MPRKPIDIDEKLKDLRSILEKYNGIPSQTVDRKAYANVKYYAKNYSDNPKVKSLLEEFGVVIGDKKGSSFEESLNSFKTQLEQLGKLPSIKENQSLYTGLRYFFTKYSDRPEVEKLKYIYAHSSCYPLPDSKEKRPTYHPLAIYIGCVPDYTKWKQESAFEYILYIYLKYKTLPAPNSKPMEELKYTINKWYRYQDNASPNFKFLISSLIELGCNEQLIVYVHNSFSIDMEELNEKFNSLLIEHGACTIHFLTQAIKPQFNLSEDFVFYYYYNLLNDTPKYRGISGLGELYSSSDYSACVFVHYRLLHKCNVSLIRSRVLSYKRNWDEFPPETLEEWKAYGEYRFFIPQRFSNWNNEEYYSFDIPFPQKCINNLHPYFRYYKSGLKYLDYKLFLFELGLLDNNSRQYKELAILTPSYLADSSNLTLDEDLKAAYTLAANSSNCILDSHKAVYCKTDEGQLLLFIPSGLTNYCVDLDTVKIARNAFLTCKDSLRCLAFGDKISTLFQVYFPPLKKIIIPEAKLTNYCQIFPKHLSIYFFNSEGEQLETPPIIENDVLIWVPYVSSFVVPNGVKEISSRAFDSTPVEEITIPGTVKKIDGLLWGNHTIKKVIIKNGVTSIWGTAFGNCVNLQEVELPISLDSLYNAFEGCTSLNKINLPKNLSYIGYNTFKNNKSLTSIIISNHLRHLDLSAFSGCEQLQTLEFNFGVHEISGSLSDCSNLKAIFFRGDFRYISDWGLTFYDCPKLEGVFVPKEYYELFLSKTPVKFQKYIQIEN